MGVPQGARMGGGSRRGWRTALGIALLVVLAGVVWFGARSGRNDLPRTLTLYCYSGLQGAMEEEILPAFREHWREKTGGRVEFITTFTGSGTITDRIVKRFPAEVAILSSEMDALRLIEKGVIAGPTWKRRPGDGVVCRAPMIVLARPGNPKGIERFADLGRPGIELVQPDPLTSGAGEWALLALWADAIGEGGGEERAEALFRAIRRNTVASPASAREARALFLRGEGDALITYETEAAAGSEECAVIRPKRTVLAEAVAVSIDKNVTAPQRPVVEDFLAFLFGDEARAILAERGFGLPRGEEGAGEGAITLSDLGGAKTARERILVEEWERSDPAGER